MHNIVFFFSKSYQCYVKRENDTTNGINIGVTREICYELVREIQPTNLVHTAYACRCLVMCGEINHTFKLHKSHLLAVVSSGTLDISCHRNRRPTIDASRARLTIKVCI